MLRKWLVEVAGKRTVAGFRTGCGYDLREVKRNMAILDWSQCPMVESVPERLGGAWVFRDTRMPVSAVFENLEAGASIEEIIEQFDAGLSSRLLLTKGGGVRDSGCSDPAFYFRLRSRSRALRTPSTEFRNAFSSCSTL